MFGTPGTVRDVSNPFLTRSVNVPAIDTDVRLLLRLRGEPQCLFGEGPAERRDRLKSLVAAEGALAVSVPQPTTDVKTAAVTEGLFFTEGSEALKEARRFVARYSIPRSFKRLSEHRKRFQHEGVMAREAERSAYCHELQRTLRIDCSKVADIRSLTAAKFSPDSKYLAVSSFSGLVKLWENPGGAPICQMEDVHQDRVHGLAWNPHWGSGPPLAIVTGDAAGKMAFWSLDGEGGKLVPNPINVFEGHEERVNRVDFHPSGRYMASSSHDETWRWWDVETNKELLVQEGHARAVFGIKHHPDGSLLVSSDLGGIIRVWDLRIGRSIVTLIGHVRQVLGVDFHPVSSHIIASSSGDRSVKLWDLRKKDCFETVLAHTHLISSVQFEPNQGRFMLTASYDKELRLWAASDYKCFKVLLGHEGIVTAADIAPSGQSIASVSYDCTVKLWQSHGEKGETENEGAIIGNTEAIKQEM